MILCLDYMSAQVGAMVTLPCYSDTSDVHWRYRQPEGHDHLILYNGSVVRNGQRPWGNLYVSKIRRGVFTLKIHNANLQNSGLYSCIENNGQSTEHRVQLIVYSELSEFI